ncbi:MAG TPA: PQQ-binding-like beta-propeller repeat protein [Solirubrobacterales bacterium]|nr:PQQ-binding-like beta-propeller repeat protein [Solirubrobacterales bacterium]
MADLELVWSQPIEAQGDGAGFTASPVVANGVAYLQDPDSNVLAFDLGSGEVLWEKRYESPSHGPKGVIVAAGLVFGATTTAAFALDAEKGDEIWRTPLGRKGSGAIKMAPGYHDGRVYLATYPDGSAGEIGVLWALDARSGVKTWHFNTAPTGLWGHPEINYGGGLTRPPSFDGEGSMYIGTGIAGPIPGTRRYPWGSSRPGPNLYTNSVVKLNERTGKVLWHYQVVPHGICNWEVGGTALADLDGRKIVVAAGRSGIVVALDRETGELLWRRPVGRHNGHDRDGLLAMHGEYERLKLPMTVYPGREGGAPGPLAVDGSTVFVPVIDNPTGLDSQEAATLYREPRGELVALNLGTGTVRWKRELASPPYGPVTATNDLVFATASHGEVLAFETAGGDEVWSHSLVSPGEGGLAVIGDTVLVRAGFPSGGPIPELLAYRLAS